MKPAAFRVLRAPDRAGALEALAEHGYDAKAIAGGQSLTPLMGTRFARPELLVDLGALREPELRAIAVDDVGVRAGALVRHAQLRRDARLRAPRWAAVPEAAAQIGHLPIQARGTIGGSLAHADPTAELAVVAVAYEAVATIESRAGAREAAVADLLRGPYQTTLAPEELITSVLLPAPPPDARSAFAEVARRPADFAIVSVAAIVAQRDGVVGHARIALGGAGPRPRRALGAEAELMGRPLEAAARVAAGRAAAADVSGGDVRLRRHLVEHLVAGVLERVAG